MNYRRIIIIALAFILLSSTNSFAWVLRGASIVFVKQDENDIYIKIDSNKGWSSVKTVDAPGVEKNILAIALCAQANGMDVDVDISGSTITMISIVTP